MEAVRADLMAIRSLLNANGNKLDKVDGSSWKGAFYAVRGEKDRVSDYEKKVIFDDMISEIEEWLTHDTEIGDIPLKETYEQLLTCWLNTKGVVRGSHDVYQVKRLLHKLQDDSIYTTL